MSISALCGRVPWRIFIAVPSFFNKRGTTARQLITHPGVAAEFTAAATIAATAAASCAMVSGSLPRIS